MGRRIAQPLDRATVLREAFALLDERGFSGLSLRSLADRLGVQAPAFYWHFSSKAELLGHMSAAIYLDARTAVQPCDDWTSWLVAYGRALRQRLSSQPGAARICAIAQPLEGDVSITAAAIAEPLTQHGICGELALDAIAAVTSLAIGWSAYEPQGTMRSYLEGIMDFDKSFEVGLDALIAGLEAKRRAEQ
jgi:TetR/AcrR family tetracycline transcriptional repressor